MGNICFKVETPVKIFTDPCLDSKQVLCRYKVYVINCTEDYYYVGVTENIEEELNTIFENAYSGSIQLA